MQCHNTALLLSSVQGQLQKCVGVSAKRKCLQSLWFGYDLMSSKVSCAGGLVPRAVVLGDGVDLWEVDPSRRSLEHQGHVPFKGNVESQSLSGF
jgi:hypothetical protein